MKWLECIPNFSEGRDRGKIEAIAEVIRSVEGVYLLGMELDPDHNRSVFTFVGELEAVVEAAFRAIQLAKYLLDLRRHEGVHPRVGVADVIPFVPLWGATMEDACEAAKRLGARVGEQLQIPVYLYAKAARCEANYHLSSIRRDVRRDLVGRLERIPPDFGPICPHPSAGICCVGARDFLIAYNIFLGTSQKKIASRIASMLRRLPGVKALGFYLSHPRKAQVSMNLEDFSQTSIPEVFHQVERLASERGVEVVSSELIGLLPLSALVQEFGRLYKFQNLSCQKILEYALLEQLVGDSLGWPALFLRRLASTSPTPGGGSSACLVAAVAVGLVAMVAKIGARRRKKYGERLREWIPRVEKDLQVFEGLAREDAEAYGAVVRAYKLPDSSQKEVQLQRAFLEAAKVPWRVLEAILAFGEVVLQIQRWVPRMLRPDLAVAVYLLRGAFYGAMEMVRCNVEQLISPPDFLLSLEEEERVFHLFWDQFWGSQKS